MNKVFLIISREYFTRVKKRSFIILTLLTPILIAASFAIIILVNIKNEKNAAVAVIDENEFFINKFNESRKLKFIYPIESLETVKKECRDGKYDAVLQILKGEQALRTNLYYSKEPSISLASNIERQMDKLLFDKILKDTFNIDPSQFDNLKQTTQTQLATIKMDEIGNEKESKTQFNKIIGMVCGIMIYLFVFMFASQILRGVLEEKTNRIVEILISSVKPMQLLLGKIVGVALVGLTQFLLWIALTLILLLGVQLALPKYFTQEIVATELPAPTSAMSGMVDMQNADAIAKLELSENILQKIQELFPISFSALIFCFLFYFLMGYLLYAALYAAVGSAVDNEADSQQFILPVTIPLIITISLIFPIAESPNGTLAWWLSMIPFTSPVAMLIRIPSGVPIGELLLSMGILILFFFFVVWAAAKIYRIGILMYGKKVTYRELWKWLRY